MKQEIKNTDLELINDMISILHTNVHVQRGTIDIMMYAPCVLVYCGVNNN